MKKNQSSQLKRNLSGSSGRISRCMYCNATAYGIGCIYSPNKYHVHVDDAEKCVFCGSRSTGVGCPYNPAKKKIHIHGAYYTTALNDSVKNGIIAGYLLRELKEPFTDKPAYKLGLINANGMKMKEPDSKQEKRAFGILESLIFKLKRIMGHRADLISETLYLETIHKDVDIEEFKEQYEQEVILVDKMDRMSKEFFDVVTETISNGLPRDKVEHIILRSFSMKKK